MSYCALNAFFPFQLFMVLMDHAFPALGLNSIGGDVIVTHVCLFLGLLEILIMSKFNFYVRKKFGVQNLEKTTTYDLAERYQLFENIKIGRQLSPSFLFHLVNILCSNVICTTLAYNLVADPAQRALVFEGVYFVHAFAKLAIEVTVITFHPNLKRNLCDGLSKFVSSICPCRRNNRVADSSAPIARSGAARNKETNEHFKMLERFWN